MTSEPEQIPDDTIEVATRFTYHPATPVTGPVHDEVRERFRDLAEWVTTFPPSRERSLALTELQAAMMWMNAHVAYRLPVQAGHPVPTHRPISVADGEAASNV